MHIRAHLTSSEEVPVVAVGAGKPELWVIAGVHGDEVEGIACVEDVLETLKPVKGRLVGVPVAHPAALMMGTRRGPDGFDLNRTYPGRADGGETERIANDLWHHIEDSSASAVITIHSWSRAGCAIPHVEVSERDERGRELASALDLPFVLPLVWPDGLLPKVVGTVGIPAVEIELGGLGAQTQASLRTGIDAVRRAAAWLGMLDIRLPPAAKPVVARHVPVITTRAGRVRHRVDLGAPIDRGEVVAELRDFRGRTRERLEAPEAGWMGIHVTYGFVDPKTEVATIFQPW
jgi:predicted deacylase